MSYKDVLRASMVSNEAFVEALKRTVDEDGFSVKKLSDVSGVPGSTLYKIMSGERSDPQVSTLRQIVNGIKTLEGFDEGTNMVAIVASSAVVDNLRKSQLDDTRIKTYFASSYEDVIVAAVRAERDGCRAIVCAPIMSALIEKIVGVPVVGMRPSENEIIHALDVAIKKAGF